MNPACQHWNLHNASLAVLALACGLLALPAWTDEPPAPAKPGTAQPNVHVLPTPFLIPGLNRERTVRIYLPLVAGRESEAWTGGSTSKHHRRHVLTAKAKTGFGPGILIGVILAAAFSLVCAALLVGPVRARDVDAAPLPRLGWPKVVATMAALFIYALVLEPVGFVAATSVLLLFFFRALERQRWLVALGSSLATALLTYLVFRVWLNVQLPAGPWGG